MRGYISAIRERLNPLPLLKAQLPLTGIESPNPILDQELDRGFGRQVGQNPYIAYAVNEDLWTSTKTRGCFLPILFAIGTAMLGSVLSLPAGKTVSDILTYAAIAYSVLVNFYYGLVALRGSGDQFGSLDWDTIRATPISSDDIVRAKYTIGLVRCWKPALIEIAIRMVPILLILVVVAVLVPLSRQPFIIIVFILGASILVAVMIVLEPIWRLRVINALGVAIAAQGVNTTFAALSTVGSILIVLVAEVTLFLVANSAVDTLLQQFGRIEPQYILLVGLAKAVVLLALVFLFLKTIQRFALYRASILFKHHE